MMSGEDIHRLVSPRLNRFLKVAPPSPSSSSSSSSTSSSSAAHPASPSSGNREYTVNSLYNIPSISPKPSDSHQGSASHSPVTTSETIQSTSTSQASTHALAPATAHTTHTAHTASKVIEELHPILTEEAVGGKIPAWGFSLRLVTGGFLAGDGCSRCPWLARCQGCLIPRSGAMVCRVHGQ